MKISPPLKLTCWNTVAATYFIGSSSYFIPITSDSQTKSGLICKKHLTKIIVSSSDALEQMLIIRLDDAKEQVFFTLNSLHLTFILFYPLQLHFLQLQADAKQLQRKHATRIASQYGNTNYYFNVISVELRFKNLLNIYGMNFKKESTTS